MPDPTAPGSWRDRFEFDGWTAITAIDAELPQQTIRTGALLVAATGAAFSLLYLVTGPGAFVPPNLIAAGAFLVIAQARRFDGTARVFAGITVAILLFAYQLALVGGVDNGITLWLTVPTFASMTLGLRRTSIYAFVLSMAVIVAVVLGARLGWLVPQVRIPLDDVVIAASMAGVILLSGLFVQVTVRTRHRLLGEVDGRTRALAGALEEARAAKAVAVEAAEAKDRFFANLTHEIRTPLNGIAGSAELLLGTELTPEQGPLASALVASTQNLVALVNALLDHARLVAGDSILDVEPVNVRAMAGDLSHLFAVQALGKGISFDVTVDDAVPACIESDAIKLHQILVNLVGNAVKFTDQGQIGLSFHWEPGPATGAGTLVAIVRDTGDGIPVDMTEAVFQPFVQGDATIRRAHGGTGLGLAIARRLAGLLGGSVELLVEAGPGSTFVVRLPARELDPVAGRPAEPVPSASPGFPAPEGLRVLLVEDNDINRMVATAMLRRQGLEVTVATDGQAAVTLAASGAFALILMDLQMPVLDGIAAARAIRLREAEIGARPVPIVAMSGNSPEDYGEACRVAGISGFLMKPVTTEELRRVVAGLAPGD
jgi:signal transduction histidine kinase/CheY-like chemotaxis protein